MTLPDTYIPSSAVWRATRGTGEDVREPVGETERLPPSDPRFIVRVLFVFTSGWRSRYVYRISRDIHA
jgi:hypothetical protein